ncbi:unnamed protein product [Allacma fusca]|uniref:Diacylglycerol O-acyltransferase n=1 Tax=Allacma fusca TaxID=39272 RepID=A0A8J2P0D4_9HEXA|nr:unnamed protein product [Allacma fusca]
MDTFFKIEKQVKILLVCFVIIVATVILFIPVFLIISVIRALVWTFAKIFRPDLDGFVDGQNSLHALKFSNKATTNIVICAILEGQIPLEIIRKNVQEKLFPSESPANLSYKVFKNTWTNFMGWAFWKRDLDFDFRNHIRDYDYEGKLAIPNPCNEEDFRNVLGKIVQAPWDRERSPWEILRVPNFLYNGCKNSMIVIRVEHVLGDGYSILDTIKTITGSEFPVPKLSLLSKKLSFWDKIGKFLRTPYDLAENILMIVESKSKFVNQGRLETEEIVSIAPKVDVGLLKKIKNHFRVSYVSVTYAAIAGAIERALKEDGQKIPKTLITSIILPRPNHPGGMCSQFSVVVVEVPISGGSPIQRLRQIEKNFEDICQSSAVIGYSIITIVSGYFPVFLRRIIIRSTLGLGVMSCCSNFPTTTAPDYFEGHEILGLFMGVGNVGPLGLMVSTCGMNNKQVFNFNIRKNLFSSDAAARNLGLYVTQELELLGSAF